MLPDDLRLEGKLPELWFSKDHLPVLGLERIALVAVPMRLPRIGALIWIGSCLQEVLLLHRPVEEQDDEILYAVLLIGKIVCDKR